MGRPQICLICHKISSTPGDEEEEEDPLGSNNDHDDCEGEDWTKVEERMKIFIRFLRSYLNLDKDKAAAGEGISWEDVAITGGILTCGECSKTVDSFCELYEEMKGIELRLQSNLKTLTNVMFLAQGGTLQMKGFREAVTNRLGLGDKVASKMISLKREIVAKGRRRLEAPSQYLTPEEDPLALPDDLNEASSSSTVPCTAKSAGSSKSRRIQVRMRQRQRQQQPSRLPTPQAEWQPPDVVKKEEESDSSFEDDVAAPEEAIMSPPFPEPVPASGLPLSSIVTATPTKSGKLKISSSKNPTTGLFTCPLCPKEFKLRKCITGHYQSQHLNIRYECTKCNKEFTLRAAYLRHYQHVHMGVRKFKCDSCNSSFTRKCHLDVHNPKKCGERMKLGSPVIAGPSPKTTAKGRWKEDSQKKSQTKPSPVNRFKQIGFRCRPCKLGFHTAKAHLARHKATVHATTREFVCEICGAEFKRADHLEDHRNGVHFGIKRQRYARSKKRNADPSRSIGQGSGNEAINTHLQTSKCD